MSAALDQWRAEVASGATTLGFAEWQDTPPGEEEPPREDEDSTFPYNALARMGVTNVVIEYSGSNDEGYVNEVIAEGLPEGVELSDEIEETMRDAAYDLLARYHAGWEINEGAMGQILIDVQAKKGTIHHGDCVETYEYTDTEVS